jgi:hypothetical protein
VNAKPGSSNRIAQKFAKPGEEPEPFIFVDARTVSAGPQNPGMPPRYTVDDLMVLSSPNDQLVIGESNLGIEPDALMAGFRGNEAELEKRLIRTPPVFAVAVSEGGNQSPQIPGHDFMRNTESKPRMLVFGDAGWISDRGLASRGDNYDLFVSCLNWLHERPEIGTQPIADKVKAEYNLPPDISPPRLLFMPGLVILLFVICAGTGVWLVRRR